MIDALVAGRLLGAPVERTTNAGKRYCTAKLRVSTRDGETVFVNVIAFDNIAVTALLALGDGDSAALSGEVTPKAWLDKEGKARASLDLLAHAVNSPFSVTRKRRAALAAAATPAAGELPFDDSLQGVA
jgi:single-stranded DNA-binding protein